MTSPTLRDAENAAAWDLRSAWATGRPVRIVLRNERGIEIVEGTVEHVASTDAFALLRLIEDPDRMSMNDLILDAAGGLPLPEPVHVPLRYVDQVLKPHFVDEGAVLPWTPRGRAFKDQLSIEGQRFLAEDEAPAVSSRKGKRAMQRAVEMMLPAHQMQVIAALDRVTLGAPRGRKRESARTAAVAAEVGRSVRWTSRQLRQLSRPGLVSWRRDGRWDTWRVGG